METGWWNVSLNLWPSQKANFFQWLAKVSITTSIHASDFKSNYQTNHETAMYRKMKVFNLNNIWLTLALSFGTKIELWNNRMISEQWIWKYVCYGLICGTVIAFTPTEWSKPWNPHQDSWSLSQNLNPAFLNIKQTWPQCLVSCYTKIAFTDIIELIIERKENLMSTTSSKSYRKHHQHIFLF